MDFDYNRLLADAARELAHEPSNATTMDHVVALCVDSVPGCDAAGVSVADGADIRTLATTDDSLVVMDQLQLTLGEGPTLEALHNRESVVCLRLADDHRWPRWGRRVVEESGHASLMSFCLFASDDSSGTLVLYSRKEDGFDHEDLLEGQVLAGQASVALAANLKEQQLTQALETRTVIGQATGILIERFGVKPDQAFAVMRRVSQNHNIKLHLLAEHLVQTGVLLDPSQSNGESRARTSEVAASPDAQTG
ncbi:MAG TPA: GAF and ANTAR domain-containing protein [Nocardioides sp.]|nr:GAF and ANTAR domain-containing protein [Nocardioides sp.]